MTKNAPDANGDARAHRRRHGAEDHGAKARDGQDEVENARDEDRAERVLEAHLPARHERREVAIKAHARRERDGHVNEQAHHRREDARGERRGEEGAVARDAGACRDIRAG